MRYRWQRRAAAPSKARKRHPVLQRRLKLKCPPQHPQSPNPKPQTQPLLLLRIGTNLPLKIGTSQSIKSGLLPQTPSLPQRLLQRSLQRQLPRKKSKLQEPTLPLLLLAITLPVTPPPPPPPPPLLHPATTAPVMPERAPPQRAAPRNRTRRMLPPVQKILLPLLVTGIRRHQIMLLGTMLLQQQAVGMEELLFLTAIGKFLSFPFSF